MAHVLKPKPTQLGQMRGIPYRCVKCGGIQFDTGYRTSEITNCNRSNCHGDDIRPAGPLQNATIILYQIDQEKKRE